ncbi:MAG: hypothetical protein WCA07_03685 [Gloeobacterales cyanobacterium]
MNTFEYELLIGKNDDSVDSGVLWYLASTPKLLGANLLEILNRLGSEGWEVVGIADVMFDARTEIILKRGIA